MLIDRACFERGCACYDDRTDKDPVEVVKREWVGLTDEDRLSLCKQFPSSLTYNQIDAIEAKLKEKNT